MINRNIQILRGVSVLLVLLFHLDIEAFKFGYLGVDIFFLISGFLMPLILPKYDAVGFIQARIKRLLPAMSAVVITSLIFGYVLLLPGEYYNLALSSLSSLLFSSQFYFVFNTGYFDQESIYQPLLHTWSLGNEFLAYILVFLALLVLPREKMKLFSMVVTIFSLAYLLWSLTFSSINYLDPISRMFLFFLSFTVSIERERIMCSDKRLLLVSIVSFLLAYYLYWDDVVQKIWPNYAIILLPFIVMPLILMKSDITPFNVVNSLFHRLGDWSYSIYIWHWPIIAFERIYLRNAHIGIFESIVLLITSVFVGVFSYHFLEKRRAFGNICSVFSVIIVFAIVITNGASYRTPESLSNYTLVEAMTDSEYFLSQEIYQDIKVFTISRGVEEGVTLIVGDSHSRHILPIYKSGDKGTIYRVSMQPDVLNERWSSFQSLVEHFDVDKIIFAYRLHRKDIGDVESLMSNVNELLLSSDYEIDFLRDIPSFDGDPVACLFSIESDLMFKGCGFDIRLGLPVDKVFNRTDPVWKEVVRKASQEINLIDTHQLLCDKGRCLTEINNEFILRDSNHFNEKMSNETNYQLYHMFFEPN